MTFMTRAKTFSGVHMGWRATTRWLSVPRNRSLLSASIAIAYILLFLATFSQVGLSISIVSIVPVLVIGWAHGSLAGFLAGLWTIPLNLLLCFVAGLADPTPYLTRGGLGGSLAAAVAGLIVGRLSDLTNVVRRSRDEMEQRVKERTAELTQLNKELQKSLLIRDQFMANMSHELRTPLNAILGFASILELGMEDDIDAQKELLGAIRTNGQRLLILINGVLDLAKLEAGQMRVILTLEKPQELVEKTVQAMRSLAHSKGLTVEVHTAPDVPEVVQCDALKVQQIITNLVGNAVKFTPKGTIQIMVSAQSGESPKWSIAVQDTGIGISPDEVPYIFQAFRQVDESSTRQQGGTGLGLAIVKRFTDLMSGHIELVSEVGQGSTFTVTLPQRYSPELADASTVVA
jgi:signal transduction histidine kinase